MTDITRPSFDIYKNIFAVVGARVLWKIRNGLHSDKERMMCAKGEYSNNKTLRMQTVQTGFAIPHCYTQTGVVVNGGTIPWEGSIFLTMIRVGFF